MICQGSENESIYSFQECEASDNLIKEIILQHIDTLLLNFNHVITDASGAKDFIYQLAENHSSISQNRNLVKHEYIPSRSLKVLSKKS